MDKIDYLIRDLCEIPDRNSPDDQPEMLLVTAAEIRTAVERWMPAKDGERYRWLRDRLMAADFDWQESGECALVFAWPKDCAVSGNCDATIDGAMLVTANAKNQGDSGGFIAGGSPGLPG